MISIATTLEANEYEDAENPNTDDCKVLPKLLAELVIIYKTPMMSQSTLLTACRLCICTKQFFRKIAKQTTLDKYVLKKLYAFEVL
jgi:hypothetical protein